MGKKQRKKPNQPTKKKKNQADAGIEKLQWLFTINNFKE